MAMLAEFDRYSEQQLQRQNEERLRQAEERLRQAEERLRREQDAREQEQRERLRVMMRFGGGGAPSF
jgi:hypothetical protein